MGRPSSPLFQSFVDTGETRSVSHTPSLARSLASAVPFACVSSQLLAELVLLPPVHPSVCFSTPVLRMCTPPLVEPHPPWVTLSRPPSKPSRTPTTTTCQHSGNSLTSLPSACHSKSSPTGSRRTPPSALPPALLSSHRSKQLVSFKPSRIKIRRRWRRSWRRGRCSR